MNKKRVLNGVLWFWAVASTLAYAHQFQGFVRPLLELLGLS